jgi:antitoxin CcdA
MHNLTYNICMSEVITIRVDKSLKGKIRRYNINASKISRQALEEEIKKREIQELTKAIIDMKTLLEKIPDDEIIKAIRESRDQR